MASFANFTRPMPSGEAVIAMSGFPVNNYSRKLAVHWFCAEGALKRCERFGDKRKLLVDVTCVGTFYAPKSIAFGHAKRAGAN
jgi:hypothetical protein